MLDSCVGFTTTAAVIPIIHLTRIRSSSTADDGIVDSPEQNKSLPSPDNNSTPAAANRYTTLRNYRKQQVMSS